MSVIDFETKKTRAMTQRSESLGRLENAIAQAEKNATGGDAGSVEDLKRAYSSALAAVSRLRNCDANDINIATDNADTALRVAFERLEGIGQVDLTTDESRDNA